MTAFHLGDHAAGYDALVHQLGRFAHMEPGDQGTRVVLIPHNAGDIRQLMRHSALSTPARREAAVSALMLYTFPASS